MGPPARTPRHARRPRRPSADVSPDRCNSHPAGSAARHCVAPYICADYAPSNVFQCPDGSDDSLFFGILPQDFLGRKVYLEFLTTITNFPIVVRRRVADGPYEIMRTENFLDTLTEEIEIVALFYSAEFSITSRLTVTFAAIDSSVQGDFDIQHFIPLMGDDLADFQVIQYLIICVQLLLFVDNLKLFRDIWKSWGYANMKVSYDIIILAIDCTIQITALTFFGLASSFTIESGAKTEDGRSRCHHVAPRLVCFCSTC